MGGIISADRGTTAAAERRAHLHKLRLRAGTTTCPRLLPFGPSVSLLRLAAWLAAASIQLPAPSRARARGGRRPLAPGRPLLRDATHPRAVPPRNGPVRRFLNNQPLAHTDWVIYFTYRGFVRIHPNLYFKKKTKRSILPNMDATHQQQRQYHPLDYPDGISETAAGRPADGRVPRPEVPGTSSGHCWTSSSSRSRFRWCSQRSTVPVPPPHPLFPPSSLQLAREKP